MGPTAAEPRVLIPRDQIAARVAELGREIRGDYEGTIYLIGILKGACIFLSDLARAIPGNVRIDFMGISSYGRGKTTSGEVKVTKDLDVLLENQDVLIVEDIVDTGVTLTYLAHILQQRRPRSIQIAALLDKPSRRMRPVQVKYAGFTVPDRFVVGYGLDHAEDYRNLPDICVIEE
jgi:hypoxanthine phosphoribosyltransferase